MTAYHGGKQKIGKELSEIINTYIKLEGVQGYVEPFCGMLGVFQHIAAKLDQIENKLYKAGDTNKSVMMMWEESKHGRLVFPEECGKEEYNALRKREDSSLKKFLGCAQSFGGLYCGAFRENYSGGRKTNLKKSGENVKRISEVLKNVEFSWGSYQQYSNLENFVIYCDPPYSKGVCRYLEKFNSQEFLDWCEQMSLKGNIILLSGYEKPSEDWELLWKKERCAGGYRGRKCVGMEQLFLLRYKPLQAVV